MLTWGAWGAAKTITNADARSKTTFGKRIFRSVSLITFSSVRCLELECQWVLVWWSSSTPSPAFLNFVLTSINGTTTAQKALGMERYGHIPEPPRLNSIHRDNADFGIPPSPNFIILCCIGWLQVKHILNLGSKKRNQLHCQWQVAAGVAHTWFFDHSSSDNKDYY